MKKILTVLLALSVVFTYTVGTAFADTEPTYAQKVVQAKAAVLETLETNYNSMLKTLADKTVDGYKISKEAWTKVAGDLYSEQEEVIEARAKTLAEKSTEEDYKDLSVIEMTDKLIEDEALGSNLPAVKVAELAEALDKDAAARYQYTLDKAEFIRLINTVDLSVYSTTTPKDGETYYEQAKAVVEEGIDKVSNPKQVISDTSIVSDVKTAYTQMKASFDHRFVETEKGSGVYKLASRYDIPTISDEAADAVTLEAKKEALKAAVAAKAADYMAKCAQDPKYDQNGDIEKQKRQKEAYVEVHTFRIDALTKLADADAYMEKINDVKDATSAIAITDAAAELNAFGEKYKAEKDASGNLVRDPEEVDALVEKYTAQLYAKLSQSDAEILSIMTEAKTAIEKSKVATLSADKVGLAKAELEKKRTKALENYYTLEQAAVNAKYDELIAQIDAAKTDKEVDKVAKDADLTKINNKAKVDALYKSGICKSEFEKLVKSLDAYAKYLQASDSTKDFTNYDQTYWQAFCIENNARTGAEVAALSDSAKAILDGVKNKADLKAERKAVEEKIAALPATITLADAVAVEEAKSALDAYLENNNIKVSDVVNEYVLTSAITQLYNAEKKAITDAENALPTKITAADKDTLKSIVEQVNVLNEKIGEGKLYEGKAKVSVSSKVATALKNIKADERKAVINAINALPLNITAADKEAVEAARALYDAYVTEYTDYAEGVVAADDISNKEELFKAEAALEVLTRDNAIKTVESLKIVKNHSTAGRTNGKSWIKIMWSTVGDDSYVDGYQVYKSTKKNSGYKYTFTSKAKWYKNTAGLKKGIRYYYKVRAFVEVDGQKYYSDWSNKAYRIAK